MRIIVTGASGYLGRDFCDWLELREHIIYRLSSQPSSSGGMERYHQVDLRSRSQIVRAVEDAHPDVIVHMAALSNPDDCEMSPELARAVNIDGTVNLLEAAAGIPVIFTSTDLVFDGRKGWYGETETPSPLGVYGRTKVAAEEQVLKHDGTVVRLALPLGRSRSRKKSFIDWLEQKLRASEPIPLFIDQYRSPIYVPTLCSALEQLVRRSRDIHGVFHAGGDERLSRLEIAQCYLRHFPGNDSLLRRVCVSDSTGAPRGTDCSLSSRKLKTLLGITMGTLDDAFAHLATL